jgi:hypothetical protein
MEQAPAPVPVPKPKTKAKRQINTSTLNGTIETLRCVYHRGQPIGTPVEILETVRIPHLEGNPAWMRIEGSVTRNLGDFNSVRVAVSVELPCNAEDSELRRCHAYGSDLVDELVGIELDRAINPGEAT